MGCPLCIFHVGEEITKTQLKCSSITTEIQVEISFLCLVTDKNNTSMNIYSRTVNNSSMMEQRAGSLTTLQPKDLLFYIILKITK